MVRSSSSRSRGRRFNCRLFHGHATTPRKMFTHVCFCYQTVGIFISGVSGRVIACLAESNGNLSPHFWLPRDHDQLRHERMYREQNRVAQKNEATLHFPEYLENYQGRTSKAVYTIRDYNVRVCSFYYIKWRHPVNLLPLDNAILKVKHNGLLTLIPTCTASNDLNPVIWGALQKMVYHNRSFTSL